MSHPANFLWLVFFAWWHTKIKHILVGSNVYIGLFFYSVFNCFKQLLILIKYTFCFDRFHVAENKKSTTTGYFSIRNLSSIMTEVFLSQRNTFIKETKWTRQTSFCDCIVSVFVALCKKTTFIFKNGWNTKEKPHFCDLSLLYRGIEKLGLNEMK